MENEKPRSTHPVVLLVVGLPALPYLLMTRGLWRFPGCPPESLEYPGHPAPSTPREFSLVLIACIWVWFAVCAGASVGAHRWLHARPERWLRVVSFVVPVAVSLGAPIPCLAFVGLATLC
jgi:hypothetical protein